MIEIQFLESIENLKRNVSQSQGWMPSTEQATSITACLRQGRLFYEAARSAPLEIRPLELYYGTAAYAKGLVLSINRARLDSLAQSHGVRDCSPANARLADVSVSIGQRGTFQAFNDCAAELNVVKVMRMSSEFTHFKFPCAKSADLAQKQLTLKEILSRLPSVDKLYCATFEGPSNSDLVEFFAPAVDSAWTIRVHDSSACESLDGLNELIGRLRDRMPFLRGWSFSQCANAWGKSSVLFLNAPPLADELAPGSIRQNLNDFEATTRPAANSYFHDVNNHVGTLISSALGFQPYYVQPVGQSYLSEQALTFVALHLLSSLVRYRPDTWMHALSRSASGGRAADDAMLAMLDGFMTNVQTAFPRFVASVISPDLHF